MSSRSIPVRRGLAAGLLALAVAALAACAAPQPASTTAPGTPAPTPAMPSTEPTASPLPTASPTPSPAAELPYCGDAFIVDRSSIVWWEGSEDEQLAHAAPEPGFGAAEALAGLDVVCAITYRSPTDGDPGVVVRTSEAFVARDGGALEQLEAWAAASGYVAQSEEPGFQELHQPPNADGTTTRKIFFAALDGEHPPIGDAEHLIALTGAPPDAIYVWHADFTVE